MLQAPSSLLKACSPHPNLAPELSCLILWFNPVQSIANLIPNFILTLCIGLSIFIRQANRANKFALFPPDYHAVPAEFVINCLKKKA